MRKIILLLFVTFSASLFAQENYYVKKGAVAKGYDVVSYFDNQAKKGNKKIATEYDGVKFYFSSQENLKKFKENPTKYVPQYGGFCAYAMGAKGEKVSIDPETFEIRDGKLYLFYNSWGTNTLDLWVKEGAEQLKEKADKNWKKITEK
ncbi:YHS domain-containing (seleno)protein [Pseudotenacibaculum haliotis]|uniref:YHS domain-containing (Seleno)protein n=1 Tax=Pseudotenacibaculum haliotis TaxID=1862138 RepID=A0ABW5LPZ6_9FLAO